MKTARADISLKLWRSASESRFARSHINILARQSVTVSPDNYESVEKDLQIINLAFDCLAHSVEVLDAHGGWTLFRGVRK